MHIGNANEKGIAPRLKDEFRMLFAIAELSCFLPKYKCDRDKERNEKIQLERKCSEVTRAKPIFVAHFHIYKKQSTVFFENPPTFSNLVSEALLRTYRG